MSDANVVEKNNKSRLFIIAGIVVLAIIGLLFYFLYWVKTPAYSLNLIREAIEKHDLVKFEKHVDTESLYNRAFDEVVQKNLTNSGYENNQLVMGLVGMLKKTAVDELINQTKKYVETGDFEIPGQKAAPAKTNQPDGKEVANNLNKNAGISYIQFKGVENTQKDGKIAVVTTKVYDKRVDKDFVVKLKMRELENGEWKVVEAANLTEYLEEREKAIVEKLNALNKPIQEQIDKLIQIVGAEAETINENSFFPIYRLKYTVRFKLAQAEKKIRNLYGVFLICDDKGKEFYGTRVTHDKLLAIYEHKGYAPEKVYRFTFYSVGTLNPFIPNEDKIIKQGINSFKQQFKVHKIELEDGKVFELLTDIPEPK